MYRYGDHTSDLEVFVEADSFEDLLKDAVKAVTDAVAEDVRAEKRKEVKLRGTPEEKLMNLLEEVIFLQGTGFYVKNVKIEPGRAVLEGGNARVRDEIKAVTWHEFWVKPGWKAHFICDL